MQFTVDDVVCCISCCIHDLIIYKVYHLSVHMSCVKNTHCAHIIVCHSILFYGNFLIHTFFG
jgi:hypothetical protein